MKTINFLNRTFQQIRLSYLKLKQRYKSVVFVQYLKNGTYNGYFTVGKST